MSRFGGGKVTDAERETNKPTRERQIMTKKHFKELAGILASFNQNNRTCAAETMRRQLGRELTSFCARQNPRFDERKFRAAAKLD